MNLPDPNLTLTLEGSLDLQPPGWPTPLQHSLALQKYVKKASHLCHFASPLTAITNPISCFRASRPPACCLWPPTKSPKYENCPFSRSLWLLLKVVEVPSARPLCSSQTGSEWPHEMFSFPYSLSRPPLHPPTHT